MTFRQSFHPWKIGCRWCWATSASAAADAASPDSGVHGHEVARTGGHLSVCPPAQRAEELAQGGLESNAQVVDSHYFAKLPVVVSRTQALQPRFVLSFARGALEEALRPLYHVRACAASRKIRAMPKPGK